MKTIEGLLHLLYQESPRKLELLCLQKRRFRADILNEYKYLTGGVGGWGGGNKEGRTRFFSAVVTERTRGNGHKLKYRRSHPNNRKKLTCERGPTVEVELRACVGCMPPCLEVLATQLDMTLSNLL